MNSQAYEMLNKAWKSTCNVLLGDEAGDLLDFEDYLKRYIDPIENRKSVFSGTDVAISSNRIPKNAHVMSQNEAKEYEKKTASIPLNVNEIKDIDSILDALQDKICYAGNIVLGNSSNVMRSHRCVNTNYALGCQDVYDGKYVAFTTSVRSPEYSFGCCFGGDIQFCISVFDPFKQTRCFETFHIVVSSDLYFCATMEDCTNCLFSFNQKNKHYLIGNVQLEKQKYAEMKAKLVGEIAETFRKNHSVPSIIDIISGKGDWHG